MRGAMHRSKSAVAATLLAALTSGWASAAFAQNAPEAIAAADTAILAYYPPAALAAKVEGSAKLKCRMDEHVALKDCTLVSETPADQGFGAAALKIAALSPENMKVTIHGHDTQMNFQFKLNPPSITPNVLLPAHDIINPDWAHWPTASELSEVYPWRAQIERVSGSAKLDCQVTVKGDLDACVVTEEAPLGYGFGGAAIKLSHRMKWRPQQRDGVPTGGAHVHIPVNFGPQ
jgi:TonB family protein